MTSHDSYLVIGGDGLLGSCIVRALRNRGELSVALFDITQTETFDNVRHLFGDITEESAIVDAIRKCGATCVIHTASPVHGLADDIYYKVNLDGTKNVTSAYLQCGVVKLVFTSSTGVVWSERDLVGVGETFPIPAKGYDAYYDSKCKAEKLVLEASGTGSIRTVVLRPCGMIGPGDRQVMHRLDTVYKDKQTDIQIGDNTNLVDWVHVGNVAAAPLLAADKLAQDDVAGEVFIITTGEPLPSYDFSRTAWRALGDDPALKVVRVPRGFILCFAAVAELWCKLTGGRTAFTRFTVQYATAVQWYNISKARKILGYKPDVPIRDGIEAMVQWWEEVEASK